MDISKYNPQQVFLLQGNESVFDAIVSDLIKKEPMLQALSVPRFTIDHARSVAEFAVESSGEQQTFVVYFSVFSPEAAQVLLKSLEEPAEHTRIIFITPYPYLVPQTVRSRLMIVAGKEGNAQGRATKEIITAIAQEAAEKDDEPAVRRSRAVTLLDELEGAVRKTPASIETVYRAKEMLFKGNLPTKFVLDYISTVIRA
jgi:hypothetical protein